MRTFLALLATVPLLLACSPAADKAATGEAIAKEAGLGDGPTGRTGRPIARGAEKGPIPKDIDEGIEAAPATNQTAEAGNEVADVAESPHRIPALLRGRWGLTAADCDPGRSDAKGLMRVGPDRVRFYESSGTVQSVETSNPNTATIDFAFTGEGMNWERRITLERRGNQLRRTEVGGEEGPVDLTYEACTVVRRGALESRASAR